MMFKTRFAAKGLTPATEIDGDAVIVSDKPLLMRAHANLLSNAYKYTERGGATIRVAREDGRAIITVADTGRGMSDAVRTRLADDAVTRLRGDQRVAGTGSGFQSSEESRLGKAGVSECRARWSRYT